MEAARLFLLFAAGFSGSQIVYSSNWDYGIRGPRTWAFNYPMCNGTRQSPVDIRLTGNINARLPPLVFNGHWDRCTRAALSNNGHAATVTVTSRNRQATLYGGPLRDCYVLERLNFHWGMSANMGSEHTLNGRRSSMEAHALHYKKAYGNWTNALQYPDGVAVVAFFLQVNNRQVPNAGFRSLTEGVRRIARASASVSLPLINATQWFRRATAGGYYTYDGSLTTPPCSEVVTWIIYPQPVSISGDQVAVFRRLMTPWRTRLACNLRPTQPLNGRLVRLASGRRSSRSELSWYDYGSA